MKELIHSSGYDPIIDCMCCVIGWLDGTEETLDEWTIIDDLVFGDGDMVDHWALWRYAHVDWEDRIETLRDSHSEVPPLKATYVGVVHGGGGRSVLLKYGVVMCDNRPCIMTQIRRIRRD